MLDQFMELLKTPPPGAGIFNPWWDWDRHNEFSQEGPAIRRAQLRQYLGERIGRSRMVLVAEAIGYQGGHFSGMAMTSERILLGKQTKKGIFPQHVFSGLVPRRTSKPTIRKDGFSEPTATIVWGKLLDLGLDTKEVVLWNAFAWHPFHPGKGYLSNRTPTQQEISAGQPVVRALLDLFKTTHILAVGAKAHHLLEQIGITATMVRHPANGGATQFRTQLESYLVDKQLYPRV